MYKVRFTKAFKKNYKLMEKRGFEAYTEKFKQLAGDDLPIDFMIYGASEGMFAALLSATDQRTLQRPYGIQRRLCQSD